MPSFDPQREELVHIAGDAPDPLGSGKVGHASTLRLNRAALGHPKIRYQDVVLEADVYALPGEPMTIHLICPRCRNHLRITADRKKIEYDPKAGAAQDGGRLDVEAFECTWELGADRQRFGLSLCRWRVAIENNVAKPA